MSTKKKTFIEAVNTKFVSLPNEELIFVQRKHWSVFAFPLGFLFTMALIMIGMFFFAFQFLANYWEVFFSTVFVIFVFVASLALRSIIDWYFNFYVVTNRKIIEVSYSPLAAHKINQVLLDQVRCTEIDTKIEGVINDLLNIGHVMITFDRPTHQEEFTFAYVKNPRNIEKFLQNTLSQYSQRRYSYAPLIDSGIYTKTHNTQALNHGWTYTEEVHNNVLQEDGVWNI